LYFRTHVQILKGKAGTCEYTCHTVGVDIAEEIFVGDFLHAMSKICLNHDDDYHPARYSFLFHKLSPSSLGKTILKCSLACS
jgi:hypothetical protein